MKWYKMVRLGGPRVRILQLSDPDAQLYARHTDFYAIEPVVVMTQAEFDKAIEDAYVRGADDERFSHVEDD